MPGEIKKMESSSQNMGDFPQPLETSILLCPLWSVAIKTRPYQWGFKKEICGKDNHPQRHGKVSMGWSSGRQAC